MARSTTIVHLLGVFLLVVGGVLVGLFLLTIEIVFKRRKERQQKEDRLSRTAMIQWRRLDVREIRRQTATQIDSQVMPYLEESTANDDLQI